MAYPSTRIGNGSPILVVAALDLDPSVARPYVIRGVLVARADASLRRFRAGWNAARNRAPATPNIDRMIDEAARRLVPPR